MVKAFLDSQSLLPLELLAEKDFFETYDAKLEAVDSVTRELLVNEMSPLRSMVIREYGGAEGHLYTRDEREIMGKTYLNPDWYIKTCSHYPFIMSAMEKLQSGSLDREYNQVELNYTSVQGISLRSRCIIFLAVKSQVLAIKEAIKNHVSGDFYVTDLYQFFQAIVERTKFNTASAVFIQTTCGYVKPEYHSIFDYLLSEIVHDLEQLSCEAVIAATDKNLWVIDAPGTIAQQLAQSWSLCVWEIRNYTPSESRDKIIKNYLCFVLKLGFGPNEIFNEHLTRVVEGIDAWKNLFVKPLKEAFAQASQSERSILKNVLDKLDVGRGYVTAGKQWLEQELGL